MAEDWIDKKEKAADMIEKFVSDKSCKDELLDLLREYSEDPVLSSKELFNNIFKELIDYSDELSNKELKQRIMMIRGYIE